MKKYTFEYVKKYFEDQNCELLELTYVKNNIPMKYKCSCEIENKITLGNFQQGQRCLKCGIKKRSEAHKYKIEEVKKIFKKGGCELLEDKYINSSISMRYICNCKIENKITLSCFQQGHRCNKCGQKKTADKLKFSLKEVKEIFKKGGCELLEKVYKNNCIPMKYICNCKIESKITLRSFSQGHRCYNCRNKKIADKLRYKIEEVKEMFKKGGCELLEPVYINSSTLMKYKCSCEIESKISLSSFQQGTRCLKCGHKKIADKLRYKIEEVKEMFKKGGCELLENVYIHNRILMNYRCSCGNKSKIKLSHFLGGHRCSKCKKSHGEQKITKWLDINKIIYNSQYKFNDCRNKLPLPFDFYLPNHNILIEYNGKQHYKPIKYFGGKKEFIRRQKRDKIKIKYAQDNNINLITIHYKDFNNIEKILEENIIKSFNMVS